MAKILIVQPDPIEARVLRQTLLQLVNASVAIVDSSDAALTAVDEEVPDLVLLHAFIPPAEEDSLAAYLRTLSGADHVQVIDIPLFQLSPPEAERKHPLLGWLKRRQPTSVDVGCDPGLFAEDVVEYLSRVAISKEIERRGTDDNELRRSDRRGARRWARPELRWRPLVHLPRGATAEVINLSTSGTLIRTTRRPQLLTAAGSRMDSGDESRLTFHSASGEEIKVAARVIRCQPQRTGDGRLLYHVAFRFAGSLDLGLSLRNDPGVAGPMLRLLGHDTREDPVNA